MLKRWSEVEKLDQVEVTVTFSDGKGRVELDCQGTTYDPEAFVEVVDKAERERGEAPEGALEDICRAVMEWWATHDLGADPSGKEPEMVKLAKKALALLSG